MATVLVVDPSTSVRETLRIVLGHEHEVTVASDLAALPRLVTPDLLVLGLPPKPRDERALGSILERDLPGVPLLLLHAAREADVHALVPPELPLELLAKPFDAYGIRARVRQLLELRRAPASGLVARTPEHRMLDFPFVARSTAAVVRRVLTADLRVALVQGETGTGVAAVARALHVAQRRHGAFVAVDGARLGIGELARRVAAAKPSVGTLFVANLERASADVQTELSELLEDERAPRVVVGADGDVGALASAGRMSPELAYLVGTLPIALVPLRERTDDIPALVAALTAEIGARMRLASVSYRPATLERLQHYLWFGNVAELEAVLTRTLVLHRPMVVEPEHLVFLPDETARAVEPGTAAASTRGASAPMRGASAPTVAAADALSGLDLEVVLGELAHELRNPMVTIKTVAQHLDGILADPEARARFSVLMGEAVGRMDGLLETLLDFARFRAPVRHPVDLAKLVDRVLGEQEEDLARRHVHVERNGAGMGSVEVDEAQVLFALRSLCGGLVSDLVPHSAFAVRGVAPGALEMRMRAEPSIATRLAKWVEPHAAGTETPPLAWALAASLLERNGGALTVRRAAESELVIRVEWPPRAA